MLTYMIVVVDDTSVSFCHYESRQTEGRLISLDDLKAGLLWAMKENLMVQFVYPRRDLPREYAEVIDSVDHIDITPDGTDGDVEVFSGSESIGRLSEKGGGAAVLRLTKQELFDSADKIAEMVKSGKSCRIVVNGIDGFDDADFETYKAVLGKLSDSVEKAVESGKEVQLNLVTDRMQLDSMNNCNAGVESITLAPDGKFYICPAFYYDGLGDVGNPVDGLDIPNQRLLRLEYAPICRNCDAYQCRRCVWLNQKATLEVNTPGHEQCVAAHLERNQSGRLLGYLRKKGMIRTYISIPEIDYLDPFEIIKS